MTFPAITLLRNKLRGKTPLEVLYAIARLVAHHRPEIPEAWHRFLVTSRFLWKPTGMAHGLDARLVISLTSYPPRFPTLLLTLKTLLTQTVKPDLVVLWVFEDSYSRLPAKVLALADENFLIRKVTPDLRSFNKLVPALSEYPDAYIATADDDIYFRADWLARLVAAVRPGARELVGFRGHQITLDELGNIRPYSEWHWEISAFAPVDGERTLLTGGAGTLYPPQSLHREATAANVFIALCPSADDLWFYFMARRNGYTARVIPGKAYFHTWNGSQQVGLSHVNVTGKANDQAILNLVARYGLPFSAGPTGQLSVAEPTNTEATQQGIIRDAER